MSNNPQRLYSSSPIPAKSPSPTYTQAPSYSNPPTAQSAQGTDSQLVAPYFSTLKDSFGLCTIDILSDEKKKDAFTNLCTILNTPQYKIEFRKQSKNYIATADRNIVASEAARELSTLIRQIIINHGYRVAGSIIKRIGKIALSAATEIAKRRK